MGYTYKHKKKCISDSVFDLIVYCVAWSSLILVAYPLLYVVSCSFSDPMAILTGKVWLLPVKPTIRAYVVIFQDQQIIRSFINSVVLVSVGTVITLIVNIFAAYPLYRKNFCGKGLIIFLFSFTMFFSGGMIPSYMVVRNLGILNSIWALVLPGALGVWSVIVIRTFFQQNIPEELREATMLDGGSDFSFLLRIVIPLSKAIIAVIALMYAVGRWNGYFDAMIYLSDSKSRAYRKNSVSAGKAC